MRLYLGGHLNFFHPQKKSWLRVDLKQPARLREVLLNLGIPVAEIHLVVVNGDVADLDVILSDQDEVKLFSAVGGG